jgi:ATP-dependent RNA helicase DeaD
MLRMGFIDDVERILQETPESRQTALFSATMPSAIRRIANTYLRQPKEVTVAAKTGTNENIRQRYWLVSGMHKLDALTRILEAENFDGMIIFSRTKLGTEELAGKLQARGFEAAAINGDIQQAQRERTIQQLKDGKIDILVATDVAARGLDVERISHVVNYDVPHDPESYTHRIGRTGRAGRSGEAILFITPREKGLLKMIERSTRQPIGMLELPTIQAVNDVRIAKFKSQITDTLAQGGLEQFQSLIEDFEREHNVPAIEIAAALAKLARGDVPLLLDKKSSSWEERPERAERAERPERSFDRPERAKKERIVREPEPGMRTYRIEVGYQHGVKPGNIVGAIANEGGVDSKHIGRIEIYDDYTVLDMPDDLPPDQLDYIAGIRVAGQFLRISRDGEGAPPPRADAQPAKARAETRAEPKGKPGAEAGTRPGAKAGSPLDQARGRIEADLDEPPAKKKKDKPAKVAVPMSAFRVEVGSAQAVTPANLVGAIANETGLEARYIGRIEIFEDHSMLELPQGMPDDMFKNLGKVWVGGQQLRISYADRMPPESGKSTPPKPKAAPKAGAKKGKY